MSYSQELPHVSSFNLLSCEDYISSVGVHVEENENVEVDDGLCEMVLCDNNNISCAQSVDRAMNAKNGWTGDVIDPASDLDNMKFP
ncbi:hypothetical protein V6N13_037335 [Hibiscus sabdariffa]